MIDANKVELERIATELQQYELQWVAISQDSHIVASGKTYSEAVSKVPSPEDVLLLKVPPLDSSLAPLGA